MVPVPQPVFIPWLQPEGVLPVLTAPAPCLSTPGWAKAGMARFIARISAAVATNEFHFT